MLPRTLPTPSPLWGPFGERKSAESAAPLSPHSDPAPRSSQQSSVVCRSHSVRWRQ
jgi:hypothetical protein